jgi:hypothetical protein
MVFASGGKKIFQFLNPTLISFVMDDYEVKKGEYKGEKGKETLEGGKLSGDVKRCCGKDEGEKIGTAIP